MKYKITGRNNIFIQNRLTRKEEKEINLEHTHFYEIFSDDAEFLGSVCTNKTTQIPSKSDEVRF